MGVILKRVTEPAELAAILALQSANLARELTAEERLREGFVTAEYSLSFLAQMHDACPSVIARDGAEVVGYALVATQPIRHAHPLLATLFDTIDGVTYQGERLAQRAYAVCGQLCVARSHRGQGLAPRLYGTFRDELQGTFDCLLTDVVRANTRSIAAHRRAGFEVCSALVYEGHEWDLLICDWRPEPRPAPP